MSKVPKRVYHVQVDDEASRLIEGISRDQVLAHVASTFVKVKAANTAEVVAAMSGGAKIETVPAKRG